MLRSIIIDDEEDGREMLKTFLERYFDKQVELVATCCSAQEGLDSISANNPDLVFLDIHMPGSSGFDMIEKLGTFTFELVFVTAYSDFAIKAFRVNALDYLLKPVSLDELKDAVKRAEERKTRGNSEKNAVSLLEKINNASNIVVVPTTEGMVFLDVTGINYCEADNNITRIFVGAETPIIVSKTLKEIEELLSEYNFIRVHRSYLVNFLKIVSYQRKEAIIKLKSGGTIPVGRFRKEEFEAKIKRYGMM